VTLLVHMFSAVLKGVWAVTFSPPSCGTVQVNYCFPQALAAVAVKPSIEKDFRNVSIDVNFA
jgi:hypothetical protein